MKKCLFVFLMFMPFVSCIEGVTRAQPLESGRQTVFAGVSSGAFIPLESESADVSFRFYEANVGFEYDLTDSLGVAFFIDQFRVSNPFKGVYGAMVLYDPVPVEKRLHIILSPGIMLNIEGEVAGPAVCGSAVLNYRFEAWQAYLSYNGVKEPKYEIGGIFRLSDTLDLQASLGSRFPAEYWEDGDKIAGIDSYALLCFEWNIGEWKEKKDSPVMANGTNLTAEETLYSH